MAEPGQNRPKRVTETGLAVVHEDEIVFPAAGASAEAELALDDRESAIVVYFPVEVEIRAVALDNSGVRSVVEDVMTDLARALATKV